MKRIAKTVVVTSLLLFCAPQKLSQTQPKPEIVVQTGHTTPISLLKFSPTGSRLLSKDYVTAKIWDVASGRELRTFSPASLDNDPTSLGTLHAVSHDGQHFAFIDHEGRTRVLDVNSGEQRVLTFKRPKAVYGNYIRPESVEPYRGVIVFSPNSKIVAGANGGSIELWNTEGTSLRSLERVCPRNCSSKAFAFSPDNKFLAAAEDGSTSGGSAIKIWDINSGQVVGTLDGVSDHIENLQYSVNGTNLVSASLSGSIILWSVASGRALVTLNPGSVVSHSANGKGLLVVTAGQLKLLDTDSGNVESIPAWFAMSHGQSEEAKSAFFSDDGKYLVIISLALFYSQTIRLYDVATAKELRTFSSAHTAVTFSPDGKTLVSYHKSDGVTTGSSITFWSIATGEVTKSLGANPSGISSLTFADDGTTFATGGGSGDISLWNTATGEHIKDFNRCSAAWFHYLSPARNVMILTDPAPNRARVVKLWNLGAGLPLKTLATLPSSLEEVTFSRTEEVVTTSYFSEIAPRLVRTFRYWDSVSGMELSKEEAAEIEKNGREDSIRSDASRSPWYVVMGPNGKVHVYEDGTGKLIANLFALEGEHWAVVTPEGRFDTSKLESPEGLHWLMPDAPLIPFSFEIFMRDYYEPKLLARILKCTEAKNCDKEFKPVRDLASLNRVQPQVKIKRVSPGTTAGTVDVSLEVESVTSDYQKDSNGKKLSSGVFDLRLFRDGQLVGHSTSDEKLQNTFRIYRDFNEELQVWREAHKVELNRGKKIFSFSVRLPATTQDKPLEFSAYAFNEDRVKSETSRMSYTVPANAINKTKPRAYIVSVGVNANENPTLNLQFAANDARRFQEIMSDRLTTTGDYSEVLAVSLISDWEERKGSRVTLRRDATKANFKAVLDLLAGRLVSEGIKRSIPNGDKLKQATPDDLIVILFSSHGYSDRSGSFYFIPYDSGPGACKVFDEMVRQRSISSDELSLWVRDIDAGHMTLIVDACYSTAAIEGFGFKPGPMGSRGLGQLAYDKGMRILTATQADNIAMESPSTKDGRPIKHGLLSYALLENGIVSGNADFKPVDKTISLSEWLEFGVADVPKLFALLPQPGESNPSPRENRVSNSSKSPRLVMDKELIYVGPCKTSNEPQQTQIQIQKQVPTLFDFTRQKKDAVLVRNQ